MSQYVHVWMLSTAAIRPPDSAPSEKAEIRVFPALSLPHVLPRPPPSGCKGDGVGWSAGIRVIYQNSGARFYCILHCFLDVFSSWNEYQQTNNSLLKTTCAGLNNFVFTIFGYFQMIQNGSKITVFSCLWFLQYSWAFGSSGAVLTGLSKKRFCSPAWVQTILRVLT